MAMPHFFCTFLVSLRVDKIPYSGTPSITTIPPPSTSSTPSLHAKACWNQKNTTPQSTPSKIEVHQHSLTFKTASKGQMSVIDIWEGSWCDWGERCGVRARNDLGFFWDARAKTSVLGQPRPLGYFESPSICSLSTRLWWLAGYVQN